MSSIFTQDLGPDHLARLARFYDDCMEGVADLPGGGNGNPFLPAMQQIQQHGLAPTFQPEEVVTVSLGPTGELRFDNAYGPNDGSSEVRYGSRPAGGDKQQ